MRMTEPLPHREGTRRRGRFARDETEPRPRRAGAALRQVPRRCAVPRAAVWRAGASAGRAEKTVLRRWTHDARGRWGVPSDLR